MGLSQLKRVAYIPPVDEAEFAEPSDAFQKFNIPDGQRVLFVGRLDDMKGADVLIEAMQRVHKECPSSRCCCRVRLWR